MQQLITELSSSQKPKIAIIQPVLNNYRLEFIKLLSEKVKIDLYHYTDSVNATKKGFSVNTSILSKKLWNFGIGKFLYYNIFPLLAKKYEYIIIIGNLRHVSAWLLLIIGKLIGIRIILWGHGISIPRYITESRKLPLSRLLMYQLAYGAYFYTNNELELYKNKTSKLKSVYLNNTISGIGDIMALPPLDRTDKESLKKKYGINTKYNMIICTRFESQYRKADELLSVMSRVNPDWGLIVIGDGAIKPNFSCIPNVYDFGSIYDRQEKNNLFLISDAYIQLGYLGLSVVEAFAYRLPVITLVRSQQTHQGTEYNHIIDDYNGIICDSLEEVVARILSVSELKLKELGNNAMNYASKNLQMTHMVKKALTIIM